MINKKYQKIYFITIVALLLLAGPSFAQKIFYKGYVVTNEGDTLQGKIPYDIGTNNNYHIVEVKDDRGFVKKFNVWQIKMYCLNQEKYYTKKCERGEMKHRNELVFMHELQQGKLILFEYEFVRKIGAARNFGDSGLEAEGEKDYYVQKQDGSFIYLPRLTYKNTLREIINNQSECLAIIESNSFEYQKIPEVIACYNSR